MRCDYRIGFRGCEEVADEVDEVSGVGGREGEGC
jgi:hypothetical protein